jgi:outer membrane lipoprotein-sorting protein
MRPADDIERFIDRAAVSTNPQADKAVLSMLLTAHKGTTVKTPAGVWPDIRNIVMRSPMMKLGIAAVVVVVAGIGMLEFVSSGRKSGVAWAEVLEKTEQTSAVVFDRTIEVNEPEGKFVRRSKTYMARDYGERSDTFMDGKLMEIDYRLPRKNVVYRILVDRKQYWRRDVSYDQAALDREPDDPRTWLKRVLSDDYVKLGRTTIDGVVVEGIEGRRLESGGETVGRFWVDVETNLPVRIEMTGIEGGRMMKLVMENFDWNAQLDESFFEPNIPADYTPAEDRPNKQARQEQSSDQPATPQAPTEQEKAALPKIKETVRLFLQACSDRNWNEMLKYLPGMEEASAADRVALDIHLGGLEIVEVGEPIKTKWRNTWRVPCRIKTKLRGTYDKKIDVHYDETLGRFVVAGGL